MKRALISCLLSLSKTTIEVVLCTNKPGKAGPNKEAYQVKLLPDYLDPLYIITYFFSFSLMSDSS